MDDINTAPIPERNRMHSTRRGDSCEVAMEDINGDSCEASMEELSLEEVLTQIEEIIEQMQEKDVSLEQSFSLYENGVKKLALCNEKIAGVEKKMLVLGGE